ncbi:MAG TPA: hypothetical protein PLV42_10840 [bacterium]|nr:hypothetical protein [bacterium]
MILVVFATPPENPFDLKLEKGVVTPFGGMLLLLAGVGERGAQRLDEALVLHPEATGVIEFGGAAAVSDAVEGEHYSVIRTFSMTGEATGSLEPLAGLSRAAVTGGAEIYRGGFFAWSAAVGMPLLYTMETQSFLLVCRARRRSFKSLRLATDSGRGDLSLRYRAVLLAQRERTAWLLRQFVAHEQ